jgi:orotate phosphoribosyltransferase
VDRETERQTAKDLLAIGAVFLRPGQPFTWASGIKSPIYCDNRLILGDPAVRARVEAGLAGMIGREFPGCQALMGTATAGIAHAAIAAHLLGLPMGYVRASVKGHGRGNRIEGKLEKGWNVVVVEDLISTGGSAAEAAAALAEAGARVLGIASIFTYGMAGSAARFQAAGVRWASLTTFDTLAETAAEEGYIAAGDVRRLIAFRNNPADESWIQ